MMNLEKGDEGSNPLARGLASFLHHIEFPTSVENLGRNETSITMELYVSSSPADWRVERFSLMRIDTRF